jgi:hypothetical protein
VTESSQEVVVSVLPGSLVLEGPQNVERKDHTITLRGVSVADTRGTDESGWSLVGRFPGAASISTDLTSTLAGSAPGVSVHEEWTQVLAIFSVATKDLQVGPAGSTGGKYTFDIAVHFPDDVDVQSYPIADMTLTAT